MNKIILIGGSSSTGKTTLARTLARHLSCPCLQLDEITTGSNDPELAFYDGQAGFWELPAEALLQRLVRITERAMPHLISLIEGWSAEGKTGVIEGEKIHPQLLNWLIDEHVGAGVFLIEQDGVRLSQVLQARSNRFRALSAAGQHNVVELNLRFGAWLRDQAVSLDLPWEYARPWETLAGRVLARLG